MSFTVELVFTFLLVLCIGFISYIQQVKKGEQLMKRNGLIWRGGKRVLLFRDAIKAYL